MIPRELLHGTLDRALGIIVYGGPGLHKTLGAHTCPPPTLLHDFEGGAHSLMAWTARARKWNESAWKEVTQEEREQAYALVDPSRQHSKIKPGPLVDVIYYDSTDAASYDIFVQEMGAFDYKYYNTFALDSLLEFSVDVQSSSKVKSGGSVGDLMHVKIWGPVQERCAMAFRRLRNYRDYGVFIYLTSSEQIDKDYVTDPRSAQGGQQVQEPFSVKGTVNIPGKLVSDVSHITDIMIHTKMIGDKVVWVTQPESLPGGSAYWDAKDRTGRIKEKYNLSSMRILLDQIYGPEGRKAIYGVRPNT